MDELTYPLSERAMASTGTKRTRNVSAPELIERIQGLTDEQREIVVTFIERLQAGASSRSTPTFESAVEEFMDEHPDLLSKLAQ